MGPRPSFDSICKPVQPGIRAGAWVAAGLLAACAIAAYCLWTMPGVTLRNAVRLQVGMTQSQVEEILGEKGVLIFVNGAKQITLVQWSRENVEIKLLFSLDHQLQSGSVVHRTATNESRQAIGPHSFPEQIWEAIRQI